MTPEEPASPAAARPDRRKYLAELLLAVLSVLVLSGVAEAVLRLSRWEPYRPKTRVRLTNARDLSERRRALVLDCYPSDPRGYFDIDLRRPEVRAAYAAQGVGRLDELGDTFPHAVEFRYNSAGFRDREFPPRRPGVRRVVVVGDSFTEGQGVKEADTFVRQLEARLLQAEPGRWEVLNYGRRAWDFPALFSLFQDALSLQPDLVIFAMVLNDAERDPDFDRHWPRLNDWIMLRRPPLDMPWWRPRVEAWTRDRLETWRISRETTAWYHQMYGTPNAAGWARTKVDLARMARAQEARGGRLLVALWPLLVGLEGDYPFAEEHARIAAPCARFKIPFRDLLPVLRGRRSSELWAHPSDRHPNEIAHRLVAEDLASWVLAADLPPAGEEAAGAQAEATGASRGTASARARASKR